MERIIPGIIVSGMSAPEKKFTITCLDLVIPKKFPVQKQQSEQMKEIKKLRINEKNRLTIKISQTSGFVGICIFMRIASAVIMIIEIRQTGTAAPAVSAKVIRIKSMGLIKSDEMAPLMIFFDIFVSDDQDNVELQINEIKRYVFILSQL